MNERLSLSLCVHYLGSRNDRWVWGAILFCKLSAPEACDEGTFHRNCTPFLLRRRRRLPDPLRRRSLLQMLLMRLYTRCCSCDNGVPSFALRSLLAAAAPPMMMMTTAAAEAKKKKK